MMDLTKQWVKAHSVFTPFGLRRPCAGKRRFCPCMPGIVVCSDFVAEIVRDNVTGFAVTNPKMFSIPYPRRTIVLFLVWVIGNWSICPCWKGRGTAKEHLYL